MAKAKVILGKRPKTFSHTVTAPLPEGGDGVIEVSYVYRTRTEFGQFVDDRLQAARDADQADVTAAEQASAAAQAAGQDAPALPEFSLAKLQRKIRDGNAEYLLAIADGWNLPEPFDLEHARQLCDELPGMAAAIIDGYRAAVLEGRRGN